MPTLAGGLISEGTERALRKYEFTYDFAVHGGATGTLAVVGADQVPQGAVIMGGYIDVQTILTGATATVGLFAEAGTDLQAQAAISGAPWSTTGRKSITPAFTGASSVKTTVARSLSVVIATANLTAGKFLVVLLCVEP